MERLAFVFLVTSIITACSPASLETPRVEQEIEVKGTWLVEKNGETMLDPQPSGLVSWNGELLSVSDRSADSSQRLRMHHIQKSTARLSDIGMHMRLSDEVKKSCFASYLADNPDLEALSVDPSNDKVLVMATEDASDSDRLSQDCKAKYSETGSTDFPSLLVRLEVQNDGTALMTHVKALQFSSKMQMGNFPNDGVEALAFGQNGTLYIGVERDKNTQARIFSVQINPDFWQGDDFVTLSEPRLKLPKYTSGNHPINGMDYYQKDGKAYLLAAARNDESLWVIDLSGEAETKIFPLKFIAQVYPSDPACPEWETMKNASIEGVAVDGDTLWLVNDPWKKVYLNNIQCLANAENYGRMSALLFSLNIQAEWFD